MPKKAPIKTKIKEITKGKRVPRKGQSGPNGEESQYFHTGPTMAEEIAMTKKANKK